MSGSDGPADGTESSFTVRHGKSAIEGRFRWCFVRVGYGARPLSWQAVHDCGTVQGIAARVHQGHASKAVDSNGQEQQGQHTDALAVGCRSRGLAGTWKDSNGSKSEAHTAGVAPRGDSVHRAGLPFATWRNQGHGDTAERVVGIAGVVLAVRCSSDQGRSIGSIGGRVNSSTHGDSQGGVSKDRRGAGIATASAGLRVISQDLQPEARSSLAVAILPQVVVGRAAGNLGRSKVAERPLSPVPLLPQDVFHLDHEGGRIGRRSAPARAQVGPIVDLPGHHATGRHPGGRRSAARGNLTGSSNFSSAACREPVRRCAAVAEVLTLCTVSLPSQSTEVRHDHRCLRTAS